MGGMKYQKSQGNYRKNREKLNILWKLRQTQQKIIGDKQYG